MEYSYHSYFNLIKKQFDKGGVLVAPAASALTEINNNKDSEYFTRVKVKRDSFLLQI